MATKPKRNMNANSIESVVPRTKAGAIAKIDHNASPGDNAKYTSFALTIAAPGSKRIEFKDPEIVQQRTKFYFEACQEYDIKPGIVSYALALGVNRRVLYGIACDDPVFINNMPKESVDIVKQTYLIIESLWEDYMQNGKVNPASGIFLGKNHYGYKDQTDITVRAEQPYGDTPEAIEKKYLELPDD